MNLSCKKKYSYKENDFFSTQRKMKLPTKRGA